MRVSYVELSGFRGFKNRIKLDFPAGFVVLTGRNGAGKSTVLDAIDFALTGTIDKYVVTTAKKGGLDSHIWWVGDGSPEDHFVRVGFIDENGHEFAITRSRDQGASHSDEEIGRVLIQGPMPVDWPRTLVKTSLIRDETIASLSMDLPGQSRFEAVRAAIGSLTGPDYSTRTGNLVKAAESARVELEEKLEQQQADLGRLLTNLTEARSALDRQADSAQAETIIKRLIPTFILGARDAGENLRRVIAARKQTAQVIEAALNEAEELIGLLQISESPEGRADRQTRQQRVADLAELHAAAKREQESSQALADSERASDEFATHMVMLLEHGQHVGLLDGRCPLCDAARSNEQFAEGIVKARSRLEKRGQAAAQAAALLTAAIQRSDETQNEWLKARAEFETRSLRERSLEQRLSQIAELFERHSFEPGPREPEIARNALFKYQENTADIERALFILEASGAHDRVASLQARIDQTRSMIDAQTVQLTASERALEAARQIDKAAKTVANQILTEQFDTVLPLLKELYKRLRPHANWKEIDADFGGQIRATLNFTVGEGKNPQFLFSSGQRRAAGMAFLLAIHLSRPWSTWKSLLLDDPVQHIDDYRALNLVEVLAAIRRVGRQVVVAVEDSSLADLLGRRLRSAPNELGRRFDLAMGSDGSALIERQLDLLPLPQEVIRLSQAS
ncbi:chromosome segregation protein SMC [Mesorhizobium sp. M7A.F.Ca.US.011.01.1.1]|uniref:AAA family ATPase n=1 Tax=Mesorhizobium sp. M7A.F.Ca.US.011.01.1.1 TaxID=2496741 RepID=UPI000FCB5A90|nr:AAA family ATPase [Mesorhizobium sp. M7A.F.Ca.US.011.01.1.1]RUX25829.1 chromosome segregation protein SMC [Mesorhizobium sp. M7A.F.Ca.US.011.01.1.1]